MARSWVPVRNVEGVALQSHKRVIGFYGNFSPSGGESAIWLRLCVFVCECLMNLSNALYRVIDFRCCF